MRRFLNLKVLAMFFVATGLVASVVGCKDYDDDIDGLQNKLNVMEKGQTAATAQIADLKKVIDDLRSKLTAELNERINKANADLQAANEKLEGLKKELKNLKNDGATKADIDALKAQIKTATDDLITKAAVKNALDAHKKDIATKLEAYEVQLNTLKETVTSDLATQKTDLLKTIKDGDKAVEDKLAALIATNKKEVEKAQKKADEAVAAAEKAKAEVEKQLGEVKAEVKAAAELAAKAAADATQALADVKAFQTKMEKLQEDLATAKKDLETAKEELKKLINEDVKKINKRIDKIEIEMIGDLKAKSEALGKGLETLTTTVSNLESKLTAKEKELVKAIADAKTELEAKIIGMEAIKKAIEDYGYLTEDKFNEEKKELDRKINKLIAFQQEIEGILGIDPKTDFTTYAARISTVIEDMKKHTEDYSEKVDKLMEKVGDGVAANFQTLVTDVELYINNQNQADAWLERLFVSVQPKGDFNFHSDRFVAQKISETVLLSEIKNDVVFKKNKMHQREAKFLIRVSPLKADIEYVAAHTEKQADGKDKQIEAKGTNKLSFLKSDGTTLDVFDIVSIKPYKELLTKGTSTSGLWEVTLKIKEEKSPEEFSKAVYKDYVDATNKGKQIAFAVAIDSRVDGKINASTNPADDARKVISAYDLVFGLDTYVPVSELFFTVDDVKVADIKNRKLAAKPEHKWKATPAFADDAKQSDYLTTVANDIDVDAADDRTAQNLLPVEEAKDITIKLFDDNTYDKELRKNIKAFYVVLDKDYADQDETSEINAWQGYDIQGTKTVVEGNETTITIKRKANTDVPIDDVIGFRVFAVNYDGTLVDPDGKAFYVTMGKPVDASMENSVTSSVVAKGADATALEAEVDFNPLTVINPETGKRELMDLKKAATLEWKTDKIVVDATTTPPTEITTVFHMYFADKDGNILFDTANPPADLSTVDFTKIAKVYTKAADTDWKKYEDGKAYAGTLLIKNAAGNTVAKVNATYTKKLPSATMNVPNFIKQGLLINNVLNMYMTPDANPATTASAAYPFADMFNIPAGDAAADYSVTIADSDLNGTDVVAKNFKLDDTNNYAVAPQFVDGDKRSVTVAYNYGEVSSKKDDLGNPVNVTATVATFDVIYKTAYNLDAASVRLKKGEKIELVKGTASNLAFAKVIVDYYTNDGTKKTDGDLAAALTGMVKIVSVELENKDFFEVTPNPTTQFDFTVKQTNAVMVEDITTKLIFKLENAFGKTLEVKLSVTIKKQ